MSQQEIAYCAICKYDVLKADCYVLDRACVYVRVNRAASPAVTFGETIPKGATVCRNHLLEDAADPRPEADILGNGPRLASDFGTRAT